MLDKHVKRILQRIAQDNETGRHCLEYRQDVYWYTRDALNNAIKAENPDETQKEMVEYYRQITDYEYYNSLPKEIRMF